MPTLELASGMFVDLDRKMKGLVADFLPAWPKTFADDL